MAQLTDNEIFIWTTSILSIFTFLGMMDALVFMHGDSPSWWGLSFPIATALVLAAITMPRNHSE